MPATWAAGSSIPGGPRLSPRETSGAGPKLHRSSVLVFGGGYYKLRGMHLVQTSDSLRQLVLHGPLCTTVASVSAGPTRRAPPRLIADLALSPWIIYPDDFPVCISRRRLCGPRIYSGTWRASCCVSTIFMAHRRKPRCRWRDRLALNHATARRNTVARPRLRRSTLPYVAAGREESTSPYFHIAIGSFVRGHPRGSVARPCATRPSQTASRRSGTTTPFTSYPARYNALTVNHDSTPISSDITSKRTRRRFRRRARWKLTSQVMPGKQRGGREVLARSSHFQQPDPVHDLQPRPPAAIFASNPGTPGAGDNQHLAVSVSTVAPLPI